MYCRIGPTVVSSSPFQKQYWFLIILSARLASSVSCSPFKTPLVMKLDIQQLVLYFLLLKPDIFVELIMDVSSFSCSCSCSIFFLALVKLLIISAHCSSRALLLLLPFLNSLVLCGVFACFLGECLVIRKDCCYFCSET